MLDLSVKGAWLFISPGIPCSVEFLGLSSTITVLKVPASKTTDFDKNFFWSFQIRLTSIFDVAVAVIRVFH